MGCPCQGCMPGGEGGQRTGYGPARVTSTSPALAAGAESRQAPAPLLPPPRNAAGAGAKSLPRQLPTGTHRGWGRQGRGGQEVPPADPQLQHFRDGGRRLPTLQHLHVPMLRMPAPMGAQGSPAQAPSVPHPLLSPTQGAPTALASPGACGTALRGCSPSTLQLSLAGAKRVPTHGGGSGGCAGSSWAQDRAGGRVASGERGSAPGPGAGWAKGLGALQGSLASAPRPGGASSIHPRGAGGWGVPGCHQSQAQAPAKPLLGCRGPCAAVMDGASIIPDLRTCPSG